MTPADLLPLALAAIEDADARLVLADALEESGWWDDRLDAFLYAFRAGISTESDAAAIAAVMLFGGWSEDMWPAGRRCRLDVDTRARVAALAWGPSFRVWFDPYARTVRIDPDDADTFAWAQATPMLYDVVAMSEWTGHKVNARVMPDIAVMLQRRLSQTWPDLAFTVRAASGPR